LNCSAATSQMLGSKQFGHSAILPVTAQRVGISSFKLELFGHSSLFLGIVVS